MEADEDLDLLFVRYRPDTITIETLTEKIEEHGYTAELKEIKPSAL